MEPERIDVELEIAEDRVISVHLVSRRHLSITDGLAGRPLERLLSAVPLLFPLCARAQHVAALEAVERGSGLARAPHHVEARRLLVLAEAIEGHARSLWLEAAPRLDGVPAVEAYAALRRALNRLVPALYPDGDFGRVGGGRLEPDRDACEAALASARARLEAERPPAGLERREDLLRWAEGGAGVAARMVQHVLQRGWAGLAPADRLGPDLEPERLGAALAAEPAFGARPVSREGPAETGALARQRSHPLVADVIAQDGPGLLARLAARLVELAEWPDALERGLADLSPMPPGAGAPSASGVGVGTAETARGPLAHRVAWRDGRVTAWQRVAPTEWTFHPDGVATRAPLGWPADEATERAEWAMLVLDPCVPFGVSVRARS